MFIDAPPVLVQQIGELAVIFTVMALWIMALIDVLRRQFKEPYAKLIWVLVIVFVHVLGAIIYLIFGRKQGTLPGEINTA